jgi:protein SCO1/2
VLPPLRQWLLVVPVAVSLAAAPAPSLAQELTLAPERPLTFVDADGRVVRSSDFAGKWLIVYFGYIHCADLCPTGLSALANALEQIGPAAAHLQPLFVTVDPERDRGPLLRSFTEAFDKRLIGLGGTLQQIEAAASALGVSFAKVVQGTDYVVDHSSTYVLIDPARRRAEVLRMAEPHLIAAKLIAALTKAGVPLDHVTNVRAYR